MKRTVLVLCVLLMAMLTAGAGSECGAPAEPGGTPGGEQAATTGPATDSANQDSASGGNEGGEVDDNADGNSGIRFGKPLVRTTAGMSSVLVLATNTTKQVKSFTTQATFKKGDDILATASGAVNDLRPGEKRGVALLSETAIPKTYSSVRVDVDTMVEEADETEGSTVAGKIRFGKPKVSTSAGLSTVDVEVTNKDAAKHSFTVQATFLKGGQLVDVASGAVNDLAPNRTKTANLLAEGKIAQYDQVLLAVDTVVE